MSKPNETKTLLLTLTISLSVLTIGLEWLIHYVGLDLTSLPIPKHEFVSNGKNSGKSPKRISSGEKILVEANASPEKKAGMKAFASGDYAVAINLWELSLKRQPNDPETLIYLNNAKVANRNPIQIAVSVPIGDNLDVAQEILRGVAQYQQEINQNSENNNKLVRVKIANDDNSPIVAKQIALQLVRDRHILAVIGHNSSEATIAAAPIYQSAGLVTISPTSYAKKITELGDYIFRTVPSIRFQADTLSRYGIRSAKIQNFAVCFDSKSEYSKSLKEDFTSAVLGDGGKIVQANCDFSASNFDASKIVFRAINKGAKGLLLIPNIDNIDPAIEVAKVDRHRLFLMGSSTLYQNKTLEEGQAAVKNMILAVPWHPDVFPEQPFIRKAIQLWGGNVNWRTALAYDATKVAIAGLESKKLNRRSLQKSISDPNFSLQGASGSIEFLPSGDRDSAAIPITIAPDITSKTGYKFVLIRQKATPIRGQVGKRQ
jgi:branched-chain amino acid transport system substrate-binding protein